jgi:hypothetical protein
MLERQMPANKAMDRLAWALTVSLELPDYLNKVQQQWAVLFEALHIAEQELRVAAEATKSSSNSGGGGIGKAAGPSSSSQQASAGQRHHEQQGQGKGLLSPVLSGPQLSRRIRKHMQTALDLLEQEGASVNVGGAADGLSSNANGNKPLLLWLDVVLRALMLRVYAESTR